MNIPLTHFSLQADKWRIWSNPVVQSRPATSSSFSPLLPPQQVRWRGYNKQRLKSRNLGIKLKASNVNIGAGDYEEDASSSSNKIGPIKGMNYPLTIGAILSISGIIFALIVSLKGGPASIISALSKSGFTAAFTLIFVSEIGDKTFFIAALLAMQYKRALVLIGSMGALSLMTILSVVIGRIFHSVPSQFQTTLPIGEYAAVALLTFFGLKSIKDSLDIPSKINNSENSSEQLGELVEAEELVKEKVAKKLTSPLEILWESFSLVFFAEWGDRSMLATIALGAAQSPIGVASGAIAGHLIATFIAILGGAFLANYISEKMVGLLGGVLFLVFAAATLFGVF